MVGGKDVERLRNQYDKMSKDFLEKGLNLAFISDIRRNYATTPEGPEPLDYTAIPEPLAQGAVRLCVLPLEDAPALLEAAGEVTRSIRCLLPTGTQTYANRPERLHITVFHSSRPDDPRPSTLAASMGDDLSSVPIWERRGPTSEEIKAELSAVRVVVLTTERPKEIEVHSVVMADSGTLLLCSIDRAAGVTRLRRSLRTVMPGAPEKQASIIHTTLLRVLTPEQLPPQAIQAIHEECCRWTEKLRGTRIDVKKAWYIVESIFATIEGNTTVLDFCDDGCFSTI